MLPFAHLGIGSELARRASGRELPFAALLAGTILPDVIDKPLFLWSHASEIGGSRSFGHTLLFLLAIVALGRLRRSEATIALAWGVASHLALDLLSKPTSAPSWFLGYAHVLAWPLFGLDFPLLPKGMHGPIAFAFEILGAALLGRALAARAPRPARF
jgi:hypothetical protein